MRSAFWEDIAGDVEDPDFLREYITQSIRIATIDAVINALDEARVSEGLSKAELARAIGAEPATVRRLFSTGAANPTLGTLAEVAAALGLRISVESMRGVEREAITRPLRTGSVSKAALRRIASVRKIGRTLQARVQN